MKRIAIAMLALGTAVTYAPFVHSDTRREERREEREEAGWVKLGDRRVDFKTEKDTIDVGREEGKFSRLRFRVKEGDVEIYKIKVFFTHGEAIEPEMKHHFREKDRSHDIDLPGEARHVKKVEIWYRSEHHEPAVVELLGKEA